MWVDINNKFVFLKILSRYSLLPFKINFGEEVAIIHWNLKQSSFLVPILKWQFGMIFPFFMELGEP